MAIIAKIYKGQMPRGQYQIGCVDDRGYVYKGSVARGNYIIGRVDNNGRIYNGESAKGNYLVGCSDNKGNIYKNSHASTSASYLVGRVVSDGKLGRVYKKTSSSSVATIEGSNYIAGAMAFLILLNNESTAIIDNSALFAGAAALLLASDDEPTSDGKGCYIATAVYKDYNAPEVKILRNYRDSVLINTYIGRLFIKLYYLLSPPAANWLKNKSKLNNLIKKILDKIIGNIKRRH